MRGGGARPPPFLTFTITSKVAVYAPCGWMGKRHTNPVSSLVKICTLCVYYCHNHSFYCWVPQLMSSWNWIFSPMPPYNSISGCYCSLIFESRTVSVSKTHPLLSYIKLTLHIMLSAVLLCPVPKMKKSHDTIAFISHPSNKNDFSVCSSLIIPEAMSQRT